MNEIFIFHSAHGELSHENFFDMKPTSVLNGVTLPKDIDMTAFSHGKQIEIIIKTNSIVGEGVESGLNTEDEYFEGDFESKYKNYLKFVLDGSIIVAVFLYNPKTDKWIDFSGPLYSEDRSIPESQRRFINKMFSFPNIEYDYTDRDAFKNGYLGLKKTKEGYESLGGWSNPNKDKVKLYGIREREQATESGSGPESESEEMAGKDDNKDQFIYLFNHILENEELADKLLNPEPLRITIFNSTCLYWGPNIVRVAQLFPKWTDIWKHEIETVLLNKIKTTNNEIKELNKDYSVSVKKFDDALKSFKKTYKDLLDESVKNDLRDLYKLVQEEKEKREKYMIRPADNPGRMKSVNFMTELEDSLNELMVSNIEKDEIKDELESKAYWSGRYKSMKTEYDLLKNLRSFDSFPVPVTWARTRREPIRLKPVGPIRRLTSNRKGKSKQTRGKSKGKSSRTARQTRKTSASATRRDRSRSVARQNRGKSKFKDDLFTIVESPGVEDPIERLAEMLEKNKTASRWVYR